MSDKEFVSAVKKEQGEENIVSAAQISACAESTSFP